MVIHDHLLFFASLIVFQPHYSFYIYQLAIFYKEEPSLPSFLLSFFPSFLLCFHQYVFLEFYFNRSSFVMITIYFNAQIVPDLASGNHFSWLLCSFDMSSSFFKYVLAFWHSRIFQEHLLFFLSQSWKQIFLQGALGFFSVNSIQKSRSCFQTFFLSLAVKSVYSG